MSRDEEPFTGFNKRELHGTLVGNWVEERQLESDTGVFRYKVRRFPRRLRMSQLFFDFPVLARPEARESRALTRPRPNSAELGPRARRIRPRDVGPGQARAHGDVRARGEALLRPAPPPVDDRRAVAL